MNIWKTILLLILIAALGGCGSSTPLTDQETFERELEMLNEHRQREWGNE